MKKIVLILSLMTSFSLFASDCYSEISQGQSSRVFNFKGNMGLPEYLELNAEAISEIMSVFIPMETSCRYEDVKVENGIICHKFPNSGKTCEVSTTIGYFILHRSSFGSYDYSFIYTRWD